MTKCNKLFLSSTALLVLLITLFSVPARASTTEWIRNYGGAGEDHAMALVETSDVGYVIAGYTRLPEGGYDSWLIKTDSLGNLEWNKTYSGGMVHSLVETSDGGYATCGYGYAFDSGGGDFWLVKTDANGNVEWNRTIGGAYLDFGRSLVQTSDDGYAMCGYTHSFGAGGIDFWLVKTDSVGNMQWNQTYGGTNVDAAYSLVETSDGGYALAGYTQSFSSGYRDFWLIKTGAYGNMEWSQTHGGTKSENANSLIETSDGGYVVAGDTSSFGVGTNALVVKTDEHEKIPEFLVRIKADGTIEGTDKIQRNGNIYTFTDNIFVNGIILERDNIVVDGNGYTLSGSGLYGGENGFNLVGVNNVTIKNTNIQGFTSGINLTSSYFTTIFGNKITGNTVGIVFYKESSNNTIYSNYFANKDMQIVIDPKNAENLSVNVWDNGAEGNYWSNYNGTDSNLDGKGETPYVIDENNQDNYPLVKQYIIPEFPSWAILPLTLLVTSVVIVYREKLTRKC